MKSIVRIAAVAAFLLALAPLAIAAEETEKKAEPVMQATCPVMGGNINKELYVDHDGKRIYVCCAGCIGVVKKDPAKYIKMIEEKGETVADIPENDGKAATCPMCKGAKHEGACPVKDAKAEKPACAKCAAGKQGEACPHKGKGMHKGKAGGCCGKCGGAAKAEDKAVCGMCKGPAHEGACPVEKKDTGTCGMCKGPAHEGACPVAEDEKKSE